jgi:hypothetical protein
MHDVQEAKTFMLQGSLCRKASHLQRVGQSLAGPKQLSSEGLRHCAWAAAAGLLRCGRCRLSALLLLSHGHAPDLRKISTPLSTPEEDVPEALKLPTWVLATSWLRQSLRQASQKLEGTFLEYLPLQTQEDCLIAAGRTRLLANPLLFACKCPSQHNDWTLGSLLIGDMPGPLVLSDVDDQV